MSQDNTGKEKREGRYARRTRKKYYYVKAWLQGLGPAKLALLIAGAALVLAIPVGAGLAIKASADNQPAQADSVQLRQKQSTDLSAGGDGQQGEGIVMAASAAPVATPESTPVPLSLIHI